MDYKSFLQRCEAKFPKEECLYRIVNKIKEVFSDGDFSNDSKASELFYTSDRISKAQFFRIKKYVKELYYWLFEQGLVTQSQVKYVEDITIDDVISGEEINRCYFADLDSALDFVASVGAKCNLTGNNDMLLMKSIVVLSWHGLGVPQILSIKKMDLFYTENSLMIGEGQTVKMSAPHFDILLRFANNDVHHGFPSGRKVTYLDSPYLMRTSRTIQMDSNAIYQAVKRFNAIAMSRYEHRISVMALQLNGAFCKMLDGKQDQKSLTASVRSAARCDRHEAVWYRAKYEKWKSVYYPDGGDVG